MRLILAAFLALLGIGSAEAADLPTLIETPSLQASVASGTLPPVAKRIPEEVDVATFDQPGQPGGELRLLMAGARDTRMMVVYGYARLVGFNTNYELIPDILKAVDNQDGKVFTFHLRRGHKWSSGEPFTTEDFRYWFEDVASNRQLSPSGLPEVLMVNGKGPKFEVIDAETVRYSWEQPNPRFLAALAGPDSLFIYSPSHYLKPFNAKYADKQKLDDLVKQMGVRNWSALYTRLENQYRNDNPDLPTLQPWMLTTRPPSERFIFKRNPYYHRIDTAGRQLPYIDMVSLSIADSKIIPAKTGAGESDLQARYLRFDNYTFLKEAARRNDFAVRLWRTAPGSQLALYPNLNVNDPQWKKLFRDTRFRRALSLAVNRHEINQVIYYGLAVEGQNTLLPGSPLYKPEYRQAWAQFDLKQANALLDEVGLTKRDSEGIRLLPDGQPLQIIIENAGESTEQSDVLELIRDTWREAGIKLFAKPSQLDVFRRRIFSGETMMGIDKGYENGLPIADMPPSEFAPTSQQQLHWPKWGQWYETKERAGEPPDLPAAKELRSLYLDWFKTDDSTQQAEIWHKMLKIQADEVFSIGLVAGVLQPVVVNNRLRNVPVEGIYNWDPGAFFGIYHPDRFWFAPAEQKSAQAG